MKNIKFLDIYLFLIALLIGIELSLGILVSPVIFYPQNIIGESVLSHFQSGKMMSVIFVKFGYFLIFVSLISIIFEILNLKNSENFNKKFSIFMLSFINFILALTFVFYFTNYILDAQNLGEEATRSIEFLKIHRASEWSMKIMLLAQVVLFFMKFPRCK